MSLILSAQVHFPGNKRRQNCKNYRFLCAIHLTLEGLAIIIFEVYTKNLINLGRNVMIEEILKFNEAFVAKEEYVKYATSKYPDKKIAIVSCMDARLTELLPAALGLKNGDAKLIKNAGGIISHPFGSAIRSLLIAIYELDVEEILVIGHTDCGARHTDSKVMIEKMKEKGISQKNIDLVKYFGVDFEKWLGGFNDVDATVINSVETIRNHPLITKDIKVYGFVIDSYTGKMTKVI